MPVRRISTGSESTIYMSLVDMLQHCNSELINMYSAVKSRVISSGRKVWAFGPEYIKVLGEVVWLVDIPVIPSEEDDPFGSIHY